MATIEYVFGEGRRAVLPVGRYPDGTPVIKMTVRPSGPHEAPRVALVRTTSIDVLSAALFWVDALRERGFEAPHLILPFVPGARQDRLLCGGESDYLFTLKSVARMINARAFPSVTVIDPHSDVAPALIDRCRVVTTADCINPPAGKYSAVIAPDGGAEKRAQVVAQKLGVPLYHAWKKRDAGTGQLTGFGSEPPPDGNGPILVVDDICDGGGTFVGLRGALPSSAVVDLYVTHGLYTQGTARLLEGYRHLYCTDSIDGPREGVIEVPICQTLLTKGTTT